MEKEVDIISMSFGWVEEAEVDGKQVISDAIFKARSTTKVLFFAAASNYGATKRELFPAHHESVTSIRATDHFGGLLPFNAPPENSEVFGTLGYKVPCARLGPTKDEITVSGTSMATPIAAGIAALILGFARLQLAADGEINKPHPWKQLWTKAGMEQMFKQISRPTSVTHLQFLQPINFVKGEVDNKDRRRKIENAVGRK